ncbi:RusA family crossover junction endodeoxyribonuclease [Clostridium perfringens]|uniref:RusA family crossover junction endodeoxyribonuclease n=1 Tax=Clostridium perfringens TaxID=1502 RepID=UPI001FA788D5|nr:RusA family crossover junction endodeoxyribonuclease [Clostridium perfringens]MDM0834524.1 RusA family crossover junction endodeoxyribonuclease [Clostridium perfringens]MDU2433665.1 RusA family crossover junction endodeoxyribonuclease [Clostridium perfringens]MDU2514956.1 RusA family crossover junction endodeoxyribonuclease [Clostridium perfringens]
MRDGLEKPTKKPDSDNIGKIILDSLNGVDYKGDSQIIEFSFIKRYTEELERVELR